MKISDLISEQSLMDIKKPGVYRIVAEETGECYVGATISTFYQRWSQHLHDLRRGIHGNVKLQDAANKYGIENLILEVLEVVPGRDQERLWDREQFWMDHYNSYHTGFNGSPSSRDCTGKIKTEQTRSLFWKEVSQYSLDGTFIKSFRCMKEAAKETNTDYVTICNVCKGLTKTAGGFQWRYGADTTLLSPVGVNNTRPIYVCDMEGNRLQFFSSIKTAAEAVGVKYKAVIHALKRGLATNGYKWERAEFIPINAREQKNKNENII